MSDLEKAFRENVIDILKPLGIASMEHEYYTLLGKFNVDHLVTLGDRNLVTIGRLGFEESDVPALSAHHGPKKLWWHAETTKDNADTRWTIIPIRDLSTAERMVPTIINAGRSAGRASVLGGLSVLTTSFGLAGAIQHSSELLVGAAVTAMSAGTLIGVTEMIEDISLYARRAGNHAVARSIALGIGTVQAPDEAEDPRNQRALHRLQDIRLVQLG